MARVTFKAKGAERAPSDCETKDPENEIEAEEDDDLDFPEVILVLHNVRRQTAAACYKASTNALFLFEDALDPQGDLAGLSASVLLFVVVLLASLKTIYDPAPAMRSCRANRSEFHLDVVQVRRGFAGAHQEFWCVSTLPTKHALPVASCRSSRPVIDRHRHLSPLQISSATSERVFTNLRSSVPHGSWCARWVAPFRERRARRCHRHGAAARRRTPARLRPSRQP